MSLDFHLFTEVDLGGLELLRIDIDSFNVTHNLGAMASACGLYEPLWRPDEYYPKPNIARDLIDPVRSGLTNLLSDPDHYRTFNPENGWGDYDVLVDFATRVLYTLERYPLANVYACR
jgi:hypothetical protein